MSRSYHNISGLCERRRYFAFPRYDVRMQVHMHTLISDASHTPQYFVVSRTRKPIYGVPPYMA